jgi:hypothetical protein
VVAALKKAKVQVQSGGAPEYRRLRTIASQIAKYNQAPFTGAKEAKTESLAN